MRKILLSIMISVLITSCFAGSMTWVSFETQDLGAGQWEYTYAVGNIDLAENGTPAAIKEFTVWFDPAFYSNLVVITTPLSASWDSIVLQPEPVLHDAGAYDALVKSGNLGISAGQIVRGFSVKFNWLGQGSPDAQRYEIINPLTFKTVDAGTTIAPEPASAAIMILGTIWMAAKRRR
jgi:hypothetical protein